MPRRHNTANTAAPKTRRAARDLAERFTFGYVVFVLATVAALAFGFEFGNIGLLGVTLGVNRHIAFLTGPIVDLFTTGVIVGASFLSTRGWSERRLWPLHALSFILGSIMLTLNVALPASQGHAGLALYNAVAPCLLLLLAAVGPWLLRQLVDAKRQPALASVPIAAPDQSASGRQPVPRQGEAGAVDNEILADADRAGDDESGAQAALSNGARQRKRAAGAAPRPRPERGAPGLSPEEWVQRATPIYATLRDGLDGGRPTGPALQAALAEAGHEVSLAQAKNIRAWIEDADPNLAPRLREVV